jgi:hypothetical protein
LAKGEEYSNTLLYLNKALEIKKEYFYFFDVGFPFFSQRNSQQQLLTGFSSTPFSPAAVRGSWNDGSSTASSFLLSSVSYFLSHYQDSEETLLLCYVQCGQHRDALSLIKFMKQQKSSSRLQNLRTVLKESNYKDESKENKEKELVNNLCHAVCLVKANRLIEAEAILSNSSSLDLLRQLNKNSLSALSPSKPTSSTSFLSPNASMIERYWMILVKQVNNERMTFAQEINNFQLNRPILSFYHQEKQPSQTAGAAPPSAALSSSAPLVNSPKDKNHCKFELNSPERDAVKSSPRIKSNENIYKTIHFIPSTPATKQKAEGMKTSDNKLLVSPARSSSFGKFSPFHRRAGSTNSNMLSRSFIIGDTVPDIKIGEEISSRKFPNHSRKSPIYQSGDLREISKLSLSDSALSLPRLSSSVANISISSQPADNPSKAIKTKSQLGDLGMATSHLGRSENLPASASQYFSDPQSSLPRHARHLSKSIPQSSDNGPVIFKSSVIDKVSDNNISSPFPAPAALNKPRYKSTSTNLFEMKEVADVENDVQKKSGKSRVTSPLPRIEETTNESFSGKEQVEAFMIMNDEASSPFAQLNNAGSLFTLSRSMKMSEKPKRHIASSSANSSDSSSSDDKGNINSNCENDVSRNDGVPAIYHSFNDIYQDKSRPLSRVEEKVFLLSSLGGVDIVKSPSNSAVPSTRSSVSKLSEPSSLAKSQYTLMNSVSSKGKPEPVSVAPSVRSDPSNRFESSLVRTQQQPLMNMNNVYFQEKPEINRKVDISQQETRDYYASNQVLSSSTLPSKHNYSHSESSLELNPTSSNTDPYALAFKASFNSETSSITYPSVTGEPVFAFERLSIGNDDNVSVKSNTSKRSAHSTLTNQSNDHYFSSVQQKPERTDGFIGREMASSFHDEKDLSPALQFRTFDSTSSDNLHISSSSSAHSLSGSRVPSRKSSFSLPPKPSSSAANTVAPEPLPLPSFPCDTRDTFYLYSDTEHKRSSSVGSSSSIEKQRGPVVVASGGSSKYVSSVHNIKVFYPHDQLKSPGPYPSDVDIKCRELFLTDQEFYYIFQMTKKDFLDLPLWKQKLKKKSTLLF